MSDNNQPGSGQMNSLQDDCNNNLVLVTGKAASGKSMSLKNLRDPENVLYINMEGKRLPFAEGKRFQEYKPKSVEEMFVTFQQFAENEALPKEQQNKKLSDIHTIVLDSITFALALLDKELRR